MKKFFLFWVGVWFFLWAPSFLRGVEQKDKVETPESPEVVLPTMVIEAIGREDLFFTSLPMFLEREFELPPLFKTTDPPLAFPPDFLTITLLPPTENHRERTGSRSSLYTESTFGIGSMSSLFGQFSLFHREEKSKLDLQFFHASRDGYQLRKGGKGFFDRQDRMTLEGQYQISKISRVGGRAHLEAFEKGLQGITPSNSNLYRFIEGEGKGSYFFADSLQLSSRVGFTYANWLLTGGGPQTQEETRALGLLRLQWEGVRGTLAFEGSIDGGTYTALSDDGYWTGEGKVEGEWVVAPWISFYGKMGVYGAKEWDFPYRLEVQVKPAKDLLFSIYNGLSIDLVTYQRLWKEIGPVLQKTDPLQEKSFYVGARAELKTAEQRGALIALTEWRNRPRAPVLLPFDVNAEGYGIQEKKLSTYRVGLEGSYDVTSFLQATLKWNGLWGERALAEKEHLIEGALRVSTQRKNAGARVWGSWETGGNTTLPLLSLEGYFRAKENLEFSLSIEDVLSPLLEDGRVTIPPFVEPGFRILFKTTVIF